MAQATETACWTFRFRKLIPITSSLLCRDVQFGTLREAFLVVCLCHTKNALIHSFRVCGSISVSLMCFKCSAADIARIYDAMLQSTSLNLRSYA
jgi:hypothetical protein